MASSLEFDQPSTSTRTLEFDIPSSVEPTTKSFNEASKEILAETPWLERQAIGLGASVSKGLSGLGQLVGVTPSEADIKAADIAMQEAPVGAIAGEVLKYSPIGRIASIPKAALAAAGLGALYQPGGAGERTKAGAVEGGMTALAGGLVKGVTNLANMGSLDRARQALQDVIGSSKMTQAQQLAGTAPANVTTAQALSELDNPTLAALDKMIRGGAGKGEEAARSAQAFSDIAAQQEAQRLAELERLARGGTAEESAAAQRAIKQQLERSLGPVRETELAAANIAGDVTENLQRKIATSEQMAQDMTQRVRDFTAAGERASNIAHSTFKPTGQPRVPGRYTYADELAQRAERVTGQAADSSLLHGENARFLQRQLDSLESYGLRTLQPNAILNRIGTMLKSPETGVSDINQRVLGKVAEKVNEWSKGGVIDARALYEIRKTTINETIDDLMRGADPKASRQMAAKLTAQIRPLIDDAIENAGGTEWKTYIKQYHKGLEGVDRIKLLDEARQLYKTNPKGFMGLVKGESPETVQKIMSGKMGIEDAMTSGTMKKLQNISGQLERDVKLEKLASDPAGKRALATILESDSILTHLPNLLNRYVVIANTAIKSGEMKVNRNMYKHIEKAMRDPKEMTKLIEMLPPEQRNRMVGLIVDAQKAGVPQVAGAAAGGLMEAQ